MRRFIYVVLMLLISQVVFAVIEVDKKETDFTVTYETKEIPVTKTKFLIQHKGKAFADIDYVAVKVGNNILPPTSAKQGSKNVLNKLQAIDNDVIDLHIPLHIVLPATGILLVNANEHDPAHPLLWPTDKLFENIHAEPGSFVFDGSLDASLGSPAFAAYLEPITGHPAGSVYGYARTDGTYLYIALDVTIDNTNDQEDWAALTINTEDGRKRFYADRHETTYGLSTFAYTSTVSYEHKIYEFKLPLSSIGPSSGADFEFSLQYYGTAGGSGVCGTGFSSSCDCGDAPDPFSAPGPATAKYPTASAFADFFDVLTPDGPCISNGALTFDGILGATSTNEDGADDCGASTWCTDADGVPNIVSSAGTFNADGGDDGLTASTLNIGASSATADINNLGVAALFYINIWLDFNADGDWADLGEHVIVNSANFVPSGITPTVFPFVIPGTATIGPTWMRIALTVPALATTPCDGSDSGCDAGLGFSKIGGYIGEIEDYSVTISAAPPPPVPEFSTITLLLAALVVLGGIFAVRKIR